jgi:hypothetical protein
MNPLIQLKEATSLFVIGLLLACFALPQTAHSVSPPPDGGYPGANTAEGQNALFSLTTGGFNTAVGYLSLRNNTEGQLNTAIGAGTLFANTNTAGLNTAVGAGALFSNTEGSANTADGAFALFSNTTGGDNTATGANALLNNTTGGSNTANGSGALQLNATGGTNTANGFFALSSNTDGYENTANGYLALASNIDGYENTADGYQALVNNTGAGNTAVGYLAGSNLTTGADNIDIGNDGVAGDSGIIRIGRSFIGATYIAGIYGAEVFPGTAVYIDSDGQLGTNPSSARFKQDIHSMDQASEAILALKPVTFRYKKDPAGIPQFGLVAEEVEKISPDLVVRDKEGKPYSVRYEAVNAMLLNEFLKEHRKVEKLEAALDAINERLQRQDAKIQKVSALVETTNRDSRLVANKP